MVDSDDERKPTPAEALVENPDEPVEGADDLPDDVKDGDVSEADGEEE